MGVRRQNILYYSLKTSEIWVIPLFLKADSLCTSIFILFFDDKQGPFIFSYLSTVLIGVSNSLYALILFDIKGGISVKNRGETGSYRFKRQRVKGNAQWPRLNHLSGISSR